MWSRLVGFVAFLLSTPLPGLLGASPGSSAPTCTGDACPAHFRDLELLRFPNLPDFDKCSYHYLKQRAGSLVAQDVATDISSTEANEIDMLQKMSAALDPVSADRSLAGVTFSGAVETIPSLDDSDCASRPQLPQGVFHARTTDEISFGSLFRLSVWYHKPLLFLSIADSSLKGSLRKAFVDIVADYSGELIFVLAETQELYEYSTNEHRNPLSGKVVSYYRTHALRSLTPVWSSRFDPVKGSMETPSSVRSDLDELLKSEREEQKIAPSCSHDAFMNAARPFIGGSEDSLKPYQNEGQLLIAEGGSADPTERYLEVPRVSSISPLDFIHRYFMKGMPVVVTDAIQTWPGFGKWNRKWLFKKYKKNIKKDGFSDDEQRAGNWIVGSRKVRKQLQKGYRLPYFIDLGCPKSGFGDNRTSATAPLTSEYFYHTPNTNYATVRHLDTSCFQTYSAQLEGRKQWILWPPENDKLQRKPMATLMTAGDLLVFYSGWAHATRNIEDKPSLAMSAYFSHPAPSSFLWDNQDFLLNQRQYASCGTLWKLQTGLPFPENENHSRFE